MGGKERGGWRVDVAIEVTVTVRSVQHNWFLSNFLSVSFSLLFLFRLCVSSLTCCSRSRPPIKVVLRGTTGKDGCAKSRKGRGDRQGWRSQNTGMKKNKIVLHQLVYKETHPATFDSLTDEVELTVKTEESSACCSSSYLPTPFASNCASFFVVWESLEVKGRNEVMNERMNQDNRFRRHWLPNLWSWEGPMNATSSSW